MKIASKSEKALRWIPKGPWVETDMRSVPETADPEAFAASLGSTQPLVCRKLVAEWPSVRAASNGVEALGHYLMGNASTRTAGCVTAPPEAKGRFFYRSDMKGFNFDRRQATVASVVRQLLRQISDPAPLGIAMQSAPLDEVMPGFSEANALTLLPAAVRPRIWIGNAIQVATHYDANENVACVVGGRRRFFLFPPDQLPNMYVGPLEMTPAGAPVSMVDPEAPDFGRYPRFTRALQEGQVAELGPGDAIFIPYFWWHAVRSLDPLSVLVNYWWNDTGGDRALLDAMLHAILAVADLPDERLSIWKGMFEQFVFHVDGHPLAHLPEHVRGVLGSIGENERRVLAQHLVAGLSSRA